MTYRPPQWRIGYVVAAPLLLILAATLFLALQGGTLWVAALAGGAIAGFLIAVAWALRHFAPNAAAALVGAAVVPLGLLSLVTPGTGIGGLGAAGVVLAILVGITRRAALRVATPRSPSAVPAPTF